MLALLVTALKIIIKKTMEILKGNVTFSLFNDDVNILWRHFLAIFLK